MTLEQAILIARDRMQKLHDGYLQLPDAASKTHGKYLQYCNCEDAEAFKVLFRVFEDAELLQLILDRIQ